jgi:hypothetical protein
MNMSDVMQLAIILGGALSYFLIARMVYSYADALMPNSYDGPFWAALFWPLAAIYYFVLKYPIRLSDRIGAHVGNWQLERATARIEKQRNIRQQLEEANRQAHRELEQAQRELEQELAEDNSSLEQQFKVLEKQQGARIS